MQAFYDINNVDKKQLNEKLNEKLKKRLEEKKSIFQLANEYYKKKERAKNIKLKIETDDEFNFFYRLHKTNIYSDVRKLISAKYSEHESEIDKNKAIRININYLKNKAAKVDTKTTNFYEKMLFSFFNPGCSSENSVDESILLFLLDQEIDLNFKFSDNFGIPQDLESFLCKHQNNKNIIKKLLERDLGLYYSDDYVNYSDLFQLSIKGEDLKRAEKTLNKDEYNLVNPEDAENLKKYGIVTFYDMEKYNCDRLCNALRNLFKNGNTKEEKIQFLNNLLYSDKVKIFDIYNLLLIREIYSKKEYEAFLNYLKDKLESEDIIMYESHDSEKDLIYSRVDYFDYEIDKINQYKKG